MYRYSLIHCSDNIIALFMYRLGLHVPPPVFESRFPNLAGKICSWLIRDQCSTHVNSLQE